MKQIVEMIRWFLLPLSVVAVPLGLMQIINALDGHSNTDVLFTLSLCTTGFGTVVLPFFVAPRARRQVAKCCLILCALAAAIPFFVYSGSADYYAGDLGRKLDGMPILIGAFAGLLLLTRRNPPLKEFGGIFFSVKNL